MDVGRWNSNLVPELVQMMCTTGLARTDSGIHNNYNPFPSIPAIRLSSVGVPSSDHHPLMQGSSGSTSCLYYICGRALQERTLHSCQVHLSLESFFFLHVCNISSTYFIQYNLGHYLQVVN
jgi:hypothetical protein